MEKSSGRKEKKVWEIVNKERKKEKELSKTQK